MTWEVIAQLALQYGMPYVVQLVANINNKAPVTPEAVNQLHEHVKTYEQYMAESRARLALTTPPASGP